MSSLGGDDPERAAIAIAVASRRLFPRTAPGGWEPNESQVLLALSIEGDQTVSALAERLALAQTTVSHALGRLGTNGLLEETVDAADRRRRCHRLTRAGQRAVAELVDGLRQRAILDGDG